MPGQARPALRAAEPSQLERADGQLERAADLLDSPGLTAASIFKCLGLCSLYIAFSACLIQYNKYLMHKDRFPYAMALTTCHMTTTLICCNLLYWVKPSLYPAMKTTEGQRIRLLRWFVPLGFLFALGLACSNKAYQFCDVSFLQFMKEANIAIVFGLGSILGLQECTRSRLFVLAWILLGASMAVRGEVHFVWLGFLVQACSQVGECGKTVLGEWMMRGTLKLDPLTYTMFMAPICLSILIVMTGLTWEHEIATRFQEWWHVLLPNACLAFCLNVIVAVVIKECSAITFILTGLVKDILIVLGSVFFLGEVVVRQQLLGFAFCLGGIAFWSHMRIDPDSSLVKGLQVKLGELGQGEKGEMKQLLARKAEMARP